MNAHTPRNVAASVRQRLLNRTRETGEDFNLILTRYAVERLLFRLSQSKHRSAFILKGAMLFEVWIKRPHRPTRDLDLTGYGGDSAEEVAAAFREIVGVPVQPDGLQFDPGGIAVSDIPEDQEFHGKRVVIPATLGTARINIQADVGFGDVVSPSVQEIAFPTLLDLPAPRIRAYPPEAVIAEKLHAMVALGVRNSRMKDFYDILAMSREFCFEGAPLAAAVAATFERRGTPLPSSTPIALTGEFGSDPDKATQWRAFLRRNQLAPPVPGFAEAVREISRFLSPVIRSARAGRAFSAVWKPGAPWQ